MAKSDRDIFIGKDENGEYMVFSLVDTEIIELGDFLSHAEWGDSGSIEITVKNLTRDNTLISVAMESWSMRKDAALEMIWRLNSPKQVWGIVKTR